MKKSHHTHLIFLVACCLFIQTITPCLGLSCEVNITYPEEGAVLSTSPVVITGTLDADVQTGAASIEVRNNGEVQWSRSGTFTQAKALLEGGAVTVTLVPGENFIEVEGSASGCSVYDSVTVTFDQCPDNPDKLEPGDCGCAADIISITPSTDNLIPGETATVTSQTEKPSGEELNWSVSRVSGNASASWTPKTGTSTTLTNVSGKGLLLIRGAKGGCHKEYKIWVGCEKCSGSQCDQIGEGDPELESIKASFSLGRTGDGRRAGSILLLADSIDPLNSSPSILQYNSFNSDSVVLRDGDTLRQIVAPEGFVDIVTADAYSFHIDFYAPEDRGPKNGDFYEPASGAQPFVTWTIENPDASPTVYNRLRLTKERGGEQTVYDYRWDDSAQTWSLSKGGGLQIISKREQIISGGRVTVETIKNNLDEIASVTQTVWHTFPWGEEIITKINDPDNHALNAVFQYYETAGADGYSLLKSELNPDGSWVKYEYDAGGRKTAVIKSWLDAPITAAAGEARAILYDYEPLDGADSDLPEDTVRPRQVIEKIQGVITAKTFYLYAKDAVTGKRTEITEQAVRPDAVWGDADNMRTVTVTYPHTFTTPESGKTESVTWPDNRKDSYAYEYGTYTPAGAVPGNFVPGSGEDLRTIITHGTAVAPQGIAFKTIRKITVTGKLGDTFFEETQVYTGSGYEQINWTVRQYDAAGHEIGIYQSSGAVTETAWNCCNKDSETDSRGTATEFIEYDALGRLKTSVKTGHNGTADITTDRTFDAMGRTLSQSVSGGSLSLSAFSLYDTAGRLEYATDQAGLTTSYQYSTDTLIETVTRPGGATEIKERYPDGRLKSVTGTGVIPRYYTYGVDPDSARWTEIHTGSPASPLWEKSVTDMAGRVVRTEKPGFSGTEVTVIFYDDLGREIKTVAPGRAASLRTYDEISRPLLTGLDTDDNGLLEPNSADRIQKTVTAYVNTDSFWHLETVQSICAADSDPAFTITGKTRKRLTGLGDGGLVSESVTVDIHGKETVSRTLINRTDKQETRIVTHPDAAVQTMTVTENGQLQSARSKSGVSVTFGYDDLGRKISSTDPRTGTSSVSYNAQGRIEYEEDPAGNRTGYGYHPATGRRISVTDALGKARRTAFNDRNQLTHVWGDTAYPVKYVYNSYGQKAEQHTFRAGTGWSGETWPDATAGPADITVFIYQESTGLQTAKQDAKGESVTYSYHPGGLLYTRTQARTQVDNPVVTAYSYDPNTAELTDIDYSDATPDIHHTYYRHGKPAVTTDAAGSRTFTYNDRLQLETEIVTGLLNRTVTRDYDQTAVIGRNIGFHSDTGYAVTYGYEPAAGRFKSLAWNVNSLAGTADYAYRPDSDLLQSLAAGNRLTEYSYETDRDLLTAVSNWNVTDLISQYNYQYDPLGRRKTRTVSGSLPPSGSTTFGYNNRSELISERKTAILGELQPAAVYTANELNQYEIVTGVGTLTYDKDGNLTEKSGTVYVYNGENRLIEAAPLTPADGDKKAEFTYDYMGRRVLKKVSVWLGSSYQHTYTSRYLYNGWNMIEEIRQDEGQAARSHYYIWGLDLSGTLQGAGGIGGLIATVRDSSAYQYFYDANGNVTQLINTNGPDVLTADDNPFRFSTKYFDPETGFYYFGYRYYDPELERWINRDPIDEEGGINLYGFVLNDGINNWDYLGQFTLTEVLAEYCVKKCPSRSSSCLHTCMTTTPRELKFDLWYNKEKSLGNWWSNLPRCPTKLCKVNGKPQKPNENSDKWKDPQKPIYAELALHPKTAWSMRSIKDTQGHTNQCTYDEDCILLRTPPSSGTVDFKEAGTSAHYFHDVQPIYLAHELDGGKSMSLVPWSPSILKKPGSYMSKYFQVRPLHAK